MKMCVQVNAYYSERRTFSSQCHEDTFLVQVCMTRKLSKLLQMKK